MGESRVEYSEISREGQALGRTIEESLEETDLVWLGPNPMKFERRLPGDGVMIGIGIGVVVVGFEFGR